MTNKTELLPCPFCGNDELSAEPDTTYVMCHGCDADGPMTKPGDAIKAWNTRAAPAEDVREVVDEPVAYMRQDDSERDNLIKCTFGEPGSFGVYRHPQRKVVMPEHKDQDLRSPAHGYTKGWNACLDEFARLNK